MNWRSLLFVPADNGTLCEKASNSEADALIFDLEDGVGASAKQKARDNLPVAVKSAASAGKGVTVRINGTVDDLQADLNAAVIPRVDAVMVPKADDAAALVILDKAISALEAERHLSAGSIGIIALIETPLGILKAGDIASLSRVAALALGPEDFCVALGVSPSRAALDLPAAHIVLAAAAYGKPAFAAAASIADFQNLATYETAIRDAAAFGASGALCIHPAQAKTANACLTPSPEAVDEARAILAAWEEAQSNNMSVIPLNGKMIDSPVARRAERIIARAR